MSYDKDTLILSHLDLARDIAMREWRTAPHALHQDEMLSLANLGLVDAANRWENYCAQKQYDPSAVQFFKVFASLRIRGTIRDQIRKDDWATRTLRSKSKKLKDAGQDEGISVEELASRTDMTVTEINKINAKLAARPISLDAYSSSVDKHSSDSPAKTGNEIRDDIDTEGSAFANDMLSIFIATLAIQPEDIQVVLVLHYYSKLDFKQIAEELNLSELKVSQIHAKGALAIKSALMCAAQERG